MNRAQEPGPGPEIFGIFGIFGIFRQPRQFLGPWMSRVPCPAAVISRLSGKG